LPESVFETKTFGDISHGREADGPALSSKGIDAYVHVKHRSIFLAMAPHPSVGLDGVSGIFE
jgi:hypothetical protein